MRAFRLKRYVYVSSCVDINKRIEKFRNSLRRATILPRSSASIGKSSIFTQNGFGCTETRKARPAQLAVPSFFDVLTGFRLALGLLTQGTFEQIVGRPLARALKKAFDAFERFPVDPSRHPLPWRSRLDTCCQVGLREVLLRQMLSTRSRTSVR
jgi:hypothetical protein